MDKTMPMPEINLARDIPHSLDQSRLADGFRASAVSPGPERHHARRGDWRLSTAGSQAGVRCPPAPSGHRASSPRPTPALTRPETKQRPPSAIRRLRPAAHKNRRRFCMDGLCGRQITVVSAGRPGGFPLPWSAPSGGTPLAGCDRAPYEFRTCSVRDPNVYRTRPVRAL